MQGKIQGFQINDYGDDFSDIINNAYYDILPTDALDYIDKSESEEFFNSVNHSSINKTSNQKYQSKNFGVCFNLGVDLRQQGDKQGAIVAFNEALSINPYNSDAYYYRGLNKADIGDYDGAIKDFQQALCITPKYFNALRQIEKNRQHLFDNNTSLESHLKNDIYYYQRGIFQLKNKEYQKSVEEFNKALQINHNFASAYYNRGKAYYKLNKKEDALKDFKLSAKIFCENNQSEKIANWTPFELGESNRKEAIYYLIPYLSLERSYEEKRLAASAIHKLAHSFKNIDNSAINLLLDNLTHPRPQIRQYALKALSVIDLPNHAIIRIQSVANHDKKKYNRDIAKSILQKFNKTLERQSLDPYTSNTDDRVYWQQEDFETEEFDNYFEQEHFVEDGYDTSMDYGYINDLSDQSNYLYNG